MKVILTLTVIFILAACVGAGYSSPIHQEPQITEIQEAQPAPSFLIDAEQWAAADRQANSIHFDFPTQQQLRSNFDQRTENDASQIPVVLEEFSSRYSGQIIMITGIIQFDVRAIQINTFHSSDNRFLYYVEIIRPDGIGAIVTFHPNQANRVSQLRQGDILTVTGVCGNFMEGPRRNPIKVALFDCEIRVALRP